MYKRNYSPCTVCNLVRLFVACAAERLDPTVTVTVWAALLTVTLARRHVGVAAAATGRYHVVLACQCQWFRQQ